MKMKDEIVDKFIRNFHNGNYDVELDDKLSSDRGTIIAAYSTQASYDNDDNWQERNEIGLEFIMETRMPYWIDELGWGGCLCLQHEPNNNNEEPIVWHEPILDEYWEQIEEEIARKKQLGIVTEIGNIRIDRRCVRIHILHSIVGHPCSIRRRRGRTRHHRRRIRHIRISVRIQCHHHGTRCHHHRRPRR